MMVGYGDIPFLHFDNEQLLQGPVQGGSEDGVRTGLRTNKMNMGTPDGYQTAFVKCVIAHTVCRTGV